MEDMMWRTVFVCEGIQYAVESDSFGYLAQAVRSIVGGRQRSYGILGVWFNHEPEANIFATGMLLNLVMEEW